MSMENAWQRMKEIARAKSEDGGVPAKDEAALIVRRILHEETVDLGKPPNVAIEFLTDEFIALVTDYSRVKSERRP